MEQEKSNVGGGTNETEGINKDSAWPAGGPSDQGDGGGNSPTGESDNTGADNPGSER